MFCLFEKGNPPNQKRGEKGTTGGPSCGWTNSVRTTLIPWLKQGNKIIPGVLGWCEMDFAHPQYDGYFFLHPDCRFQSLVPFTRRTHFRVCLVLTSKHDAETGNMISPKGFHDGYRLTLQIGEQKIVDKDAGAMLWHNSNHISPDGEHVFSMKCTHML